MNFFDELKNYDLEVANACNLELERQQHNIELIASENIVSKAVLLAAMDPAPARYYHTVNDTADNLDLHCIEKGIEVLLNTLFLFDEQGLKDKYE